MISISGLYTYKSYGWDFDFLADPTEKCEESNIPYIVTTMRTNSNKDFPLIGYIAPTSGMDEDAVLLVAYTAGFMRSDYPEAFI